MRIILVALAVILYLILSIPLLLILNLEEKKDPVKAQEKSLKRGWRISLLTGQFFMWETTEVILTFW